MSETPQGTGDGGLVTTRVIQMPGMQAGPVGVAGEDKPGPSVQPIAIPAWQYILVEIAWNYLTVFFGLLAMDGMGLVDLAPPGDAFSHILRVAGISLAPAAIQLLRELYDYLGKLRAIRR